MDMHQRTQVYRRQATLHEYLTFIYETSYGCSSAEKNVMTKYMRRKTGQKCHEHWNVKEMTLLKYFQFHNLDVNMLEAFLKKSSV